MSTSSSFNLIFLNMSAQKIILLNQKGGVGKTTTCVNLGSSLAAMGYKVLLVDFDSQCNLTGAVSGNGRKSTSYDVITGKAEAEAAVQETPFQNLYLIPGSIDLAGLNVELVGEEGMNFFLRDRLVVLDSQFDFIFVDCPPSLGVLTMNALAWAQDILIPMQCEYFSMEGLNMLMRTVADVRKTINPDIRILGIVFTMFSKRNRLNADVVQDTGSYLPELVFKTVIPRTVRLAEAPSFGLPINVYDASNVGSKAYMALAKEVVKRVFED